MTQDAADERTEDEQRILEYMTDRRGEEYVEENTNLILAQASLIGELDRVTR